jgi:thiol-disulfide isomerase/thioredoxin
LSKLIGKIIVLFVICLIIPTASFAQVKESEKLPEILLKDSSGKLVSLNKYRGKIILINFWATWCIPCRAEIPELVKWQKEYQNQGLQIIGITYPPSNRKSVLKVIQKNKINYPILIGTKKTKALFDTSETLPFTIVIDKEGRIKERIEGIVFSDEFDEKVKPLLKSEVN